MALAGLLFALAAAGQAQATRPKTTLDFGDGHHEVRNLAVSPDGKFLALCSFNDRGGVTLWDLATRKQVATIKSDGWSATGDFAFCPDSKYLMVCECNVDRISVIFWDLAALKESRRIVIEHELGVGRRSTVFTPDGKSLIMGTADRGALVYSLETGKQTKALPCDKPQKAAVSALAVSHDGKTLAVGMQFALFLFDLEKGELLRKIQASKELVESVTPTAQDDGITAFLKFRASTLLLEDWPGNVDMLAFSPDDKRLFSAASVQGRVLAWDPATGKNLDALRVGDYMQVTALAFSPDGATLAMGGSGSVQLWDMAQFGLRGDFSGMSRSGYEVTHLAFTPDGRTLITGSNRVEFWDVPAGAPKEVRRDKTAPPLILSPGR